MPAPKLAPIKAGSTFSYAGTCGLPAGSWTATCQVRSMEAPYALIGTVVVTLGVAVAGLTPIALLCPASQTASWPEGVQELDIRYTDASGVVLHTSTVLVPVLRSITVPVA